MTVQTGRRGRVFQRGATWAYCVDVQPQGAPRRQATKGGFATRREAQAALTAVLGAMARGAYTQPDRRRTLGSYLECVFLPGLVTRGLKLSTRESYSRLVRVHVLPALGDVPLASLTPELLDRTWARLLASGLAPRTVRYVATVVGAATRNAVRTGALAVDPMGRSQLPGAGSRRAPTVWTAEQVAAFLRVTRGERLGPVWHLLATTGARRGEVLGLRWAGLDLDRGELTVSEAAGQLDGGRYMDSPKTASGRRTIALDPGTVAVLREHRRRMLAERILMGAGFVDEGWVFAEPDGAGLTPRNVTMAFGRRVRRANLPPIRLHDLRHTWASLALRAGINPKVVQERLGHSSVTITLGIYSHVSADVHQDAAATVAALIAAGPVSIS